MDERARFVARLMDDETMTALCEEFNPQLAGDFPPSAASWPKFAYTRRSHRGGGRPPCGDEVARLRDGSAAYDALKNAWR